jgi:transglutaminase-like putative cysteine protease
MLIHVGYDITVTVGAPTAFQTLLDIHPDRRRDIVLDDPLKIAQDQPAATLDAFGNVLRRFVLPQGMNTISCRAVVRDPGVLDAQPFGAGETPVAELPEPCLQFLTGSRYCETDELSQFAWSTFGQTAPGYWRVQAICDFVHNRIRFDYGQARSTRTAAQALREGVGVCRDYTHLAVALTRALNIPARYVNGYLGDIGVPADPAPMDFSAWLEAYVGGKWVTFDARNNHSRIGRIVIARGRDAADVPMITSFGPHVLNQFNVICEEVAPSANQMISRAA